MARRALVVGGCAAPYHRIEPAEPLLRSVLQEMGLDADVSGIYHPDDGDAYIGDYSALTARRLAPYDVVVLYTTGCDRHGADVPALMEHVRQGHGIVGIHNAADSFTDDPAWVAFVGGKFRTHPEQLDIALEFTDTQHPITQGLRPFTVKDELYLFSDYDPANVHLLAQTRSYDDNGPVPLCWTRQEGPNGQGRVFYLSLGHNPSTMEDPDWRALFKRGVAWSLGQG